MKQKSVIVRALSLLLVFCMLTSLEAFPVHAEEPSGQTEPTGEVKDNDATEASTAPTDDTVPGNGVTGTTGEGDTSAESVSQTTDAEMSDADTLTPAKEEPTMNGLTGTSYGITPYSTSKVDLDPDVQSLGVSCTFNDNEMIFVGNKASQTSSADKTNHSIDVNVKSYYGKKAYQQLVGEFVITLTNTYDNRATLEFGWEVSGYGTVSFENPAEDGNLTGEGKYSKLLDAQASITIKIVSAKSTYGQNAGVTLKLTNISLTEYAPPLTTTFRTAENGSYQVSGADITDETPLTNPATFQYDLSATPAEGYVFAGWKNPDTGVYFSGDNPCKFKAWENMAVQPVFVLEGSATFGVGDQRFYNLNVANSYAKSQSNKTIVLLASGSLLAENYTISSGVTFLIPYSDSTAVHTTKPNTIETAAHSTTPYKTLTIPSGAVLTVNGAINVDSQVTQNKSYPTGPYGLITLEQNAQIILNRDANLYCWGYINGDGAVNAKSGSKVYECFQLPGFRGGNASTAMYNNRDTYHVFPINQYYIQNVEATLQLYSGAESYVYASATISKMHADSTSLFISTPSSDYGMFRLGEGCVLTRKYYPSTDRVEYTVDGKLIINKMSISLKVLIFGVTLNTNEYVLPITSNMTINILSGTTEIASGQDIALLPGVQFTVSENAVFEASSSLFVYDREYWVGGSYVTNSEADLLTCGFSTMQHKQRTSADLVDAVIDVNGTLNITSTGHIYTTGIPLSEIEANPDVNPGGANIFSSRGTGKVVFNASTQATTTTYQVHQSGNEISEYVSINCTTAKLKNGDGTYTETTGAQAGWRYYYDTVAQRWYRFRVKYQFNGADIGEELITTDTSTYDLSFASGDLAASIKSGSADTPTISGTTLTVSGITSDCTINITGSSASYQPYFVLNEKQYGIYRSFGGAELTETATVNSSTYYVVQKADTPLEFGSEHATPADTAMGITAGSPNRITWFLEDTTTGAQEYPGTVPQGDTRQGPVYIYGIYTGYVTYNSYTGKYYTTLKEAIENLPTTGSVTLKMVADCGSFATESDAAIYTLNVNVSLDLNGFKAVGCFVNNKTMVVKDTSDKGGGKIYTSTSVQPSGKQTSIIRNESGGTLTLKNVTLEATQTSHDNLALIINAGVITEISGCVLKTPKGYGIFNRGTIQTINSQVTSNKDAIYVEAGTVAQITGGIYKATGGYAVDNKAATAPIEISGGHFKGSGNRATAILNPDNTAYQTYPDPKALSDTVERVTLADGTTDAGYYFLKDNTFTIIYNTNGGDTANQTVTLKRTVTSITLPGTDAFTRSGFTLLGWSMASNNTTATWQPGANVTFSDIGSPGMDKEVTLYAIWKANTIYSISVSWDSMSFTYSPTVYQWNGAELKYEVKEAGYWSPSSSTAPKVTVTNEAGKNHGSVQVSIAYTANPDYDWSAIDFTVGTKTTPNAAMLSQSLTPGNEVSATISLKGEPGGTGGTHDVGTLQLTLTPADG